MAYAYIKYVASGTVVRIPEESLEAMLADENDVVVQCEEAEWTEPAENAADGEMVEVPVAPVEPEPQPVAAESEPEMASTEIL